MISNDVSWCFWCADVHIFISSPYSISARGCYGISENKVENCWAVAYFFGGFLHEIKRWGHFSYPRLRSLMVFSKNFSLQLSYWVAYKIWTEWMEYVKESCKTSKLSNNELNTVMTEVTDQLFSKSSDSQLHHRLFSGGSFEFKDKERLCTYATKGNVSN